MIGRRLIIGCVMAIIGVSLFAQAPVDDVPSTPITSTPINGAMRLHSSDNAHVLIPPLATTIEPPANTESIELVDCDTVVEERPTLSGDVRHVGNWRFLVHYTTAGDDATTPAFAQQVAATLKEAWNHQVDTLGWAAPPPDCGEGGDTRYDVYIADIEAESLGYAQPEGVIGDNPATPAIETYAAYSYLALDNDFSFSDDPQSLLRATAAHELHHSIQFGYDFGDLADWYHEATSTWMETQTFPADQDAVTYVEDVLWQPELCLGNVRDDTYGTRIYAEWLFIDSLVQDYGAAIVHDLWTTIAAEENMLALYTTLENVGSTPQIAVQRYALRNLLRGYTLASQFEDTVYIDSIIDEVGAFKSSFGVQELAANYLAVDLTGTYTFSVDAPNLSLVYIGIADDEAYVHELGRVGVVRTTPYDEGYLLVLNTDAHDDPDECVTTDWTVRVTLGGEASTADKIWDASQFITPE